MIEFWVFKWNATVLSINALVKFYSIKISYDNWVANSSQKSYSRFFAVVLFCFGGGGNGLENHFKMALGETKIMPLSGFDDLLASLTRSFILRCDRKSIGHVDRFELFKCLQFWLDFLFIWVKFSWDFSKIFEFTMD